MLEGRELNVCGNKIVRRKRKDEGPGELYGVDGKLGKERACRTASDLIVKKQGPDPTPTRQAQLAGNRVPPALTWACSKI